MKKHIYLKKHIYSIAATALAVIAIPFSALADSISPDSFGATLGVGESVTIHKEVTVDAGTPTSSKVDVYFMADTTGSMGSYLNAIKSSASAILSSTAGLGDVAFAVGEYKDFNMWDDYAYRLNTAMTTTEATAQAGINAWSANGGADWPEAPLYALSSAADSAATGWRAGSERILVWFGDAPGHDPSGGATQASTIAALSAKNISVQAIDVGTASDGMDSTGQATAIANGTSGNVYTGIDSSSIVDTITAAITTAVSTYSTVDLGISGAPAGVTVTSTSGHSGSYDRSISRTFGFDVTFTGVTPGDYSFGIDALVDGGIVATESDHIIVTTADAPEPGTMLLLGIGIAGLGAMRRRSLNA